MRIMESWRLLDLGRVEPLKAQTFYEAVAHAVDLGRAPNTIILVQPSKPYVCIGFHQAIESELDLEYCRENNLRIIRRGQGGGAVYLDDGQLFCQVIARKTSPSIPRSTESLFEKMLEVTVYVYRMLGLNAVYKPINDVTVNEKKISGNGAGDYGENTVILVGNIILRLNYEGMCRVLKVPSEKFRDKIAKSMKEWVTSIERRKVKFQT